MKIEVDFNKFSTVYDKGCPQLIWTQIVADLETPVSVFLKVAEGRKNSFLLESVEGGNIRGRYSIIGLKPDLVWRCQENRVEINRHDINDKSNFELSKKKPIESLKDLLEESKIEIPEGLPPMSAGLV